MGFVRGLAAEVGAHGVTVNCVSLGTMKTGPTEDAVARNPGLEAKLARPYPIPRLGRPEDPALLVALLCSDAGGWITGQVYPVDGGYAPTLYGDPRDAAPGGPVAGHDPLVVKVGGVSFGVWLRAVSPSLRAHGSGRRLASGPDPGPRGGESSPSSSPTTGSMRWRSAWPSSGC
jgi:Enoyl-(Acyl carrier protein) reductase